MAFPKLLQKLFQNNGAGDKLNPDIIPDIPYSKVTGAPSVDSALSSTSENPVQNKVINSALDGKLSTSGGTVSGSTIINQVSFPGAGNIKTTSTGTELLLNYGQGAWLSLLGKDFPREDKGAFIITANGDKILKGLPDGRLTWCGKNVLTGNSAGLTVVAESYGANSWYRKYSDGWIEQGLKIETNPGKAQAFTLATPFSNTNYTVAVSQNNGSSGKISRAAIEAVTRSSVTVYIDAWAMLPVRVYMCGK